MYEAHMSHRGGAYLKFLSSPPMFPDLDLCFQYRNSLVRYETPTLTEGFWRQVAAFLSPSALPDSRGTLQP